jgi:hypothetical protein
MSAITTELVETGEKRAMRVFGGETALPVSQTRLMVQLSARIFTRTKFTNDSFEIAQKADNKS